MREIKFRAWDVRNETFDVDFYVNKDGDITYGEDGMDVDKCIRHSEQSIQFSDDEEKPIVLMQYTGLEDKNDVEIYEGDVVRRYGGGLLGNPTTVLFTGEVVFTNSGYKAKYLYDEPGSAGKYRHEAQGNLFNKSELEVIGNIWENPELLK